MVWLVGEDLRETVELGRGAVDALCAGGFRGRPGNPHELGENPVPVVAEGDLPVGHGGQARRRLARSRSAALRGGASANPGFEGVRKVIAL